MGEIKDIRPPNIQSWRMMANMFTTIGTRTIRWGKRWSWLALCISMMGVDTNKLCRHLSTRSYQIKRGGVLRPTFMRFFIPYRLARINLIWSKDQKMRQGKRYYQVFWERLGPVLVASSNTGSFSTVRVITMNLFQSHHNLQ